jgi:enamine deaminase RidA (YjgF/YER057c/UK114 family)
MDMQQHNPSTIAAPLGAYSNGVSAPGGGRWLYIAGQIGVRPDGSMATTFVEQAEAAWTNLIAILAHAGMSAQHLVKVTHYLVRPDDLKQYNPVRSKHLGDARPASTLIVAQALAKPDWLFEVEAVAWRA